MLSQLNYPELLPELAYLNRAYRSISLYREWKFGPRAAGRRWQRNDVRLRPLREDFANLGMFLNRLRQYPRVKSALFAKLSDLYDGLTDFELDFTVDAVQISFTEGDFAIPAQPPVRRQPALPLPAGHPAGPGTAPADWH